MKNLGFVLLAAALLTGVSFAGGDARATRNMTKDQYINHVETQLNDWDKKVTSMKAQRDALNTSSDRYKTINKAVGDLEDELGDIREELRDLRGDQNPNLAEYRTDIDKNFVDALAVSERAKIAE